MLLQWIVLQDPRLFGMLTGVHARSISLLVQVLPKAADPELHVPGPVVLLGVHWRNAKTRGCAMQLRHSGHPVLANMWCMLQTSP